MGREKPEAGVQEKAREVRYQLMEEYCQANGIKHLFLAHHQDDQAETFLFRLAKGSGLDGLSSMSPIQPRGEITLLRPLLDMPKQCLIETCKAQGIDYIEDPSNNSAEFARARLRQSMEVLAQEGLSSKRLATTAMRLSRARAALERLSDKAFDDSIQEKNTNRIVLKYDVCAGQPEEIALRVLLKSIAHLRPDEEYAPRMEKIESLFADIMSEDPFRKRTLGGVIFDRDDERAAIILQREKA